MGLFDKSSIVNPLYREVAKKLAGAIESEFNTKVFDYGVAQRGTSEFEYLAPIFLDPPISAKYVCYFLVPLDSYDIIITNDYYERNAQLGKSGLQSFIQCKVFKNKLKTDWDLSNFLKEKVHVEVYDVGALSVNEYKGDENIVLNADKIDDIKYRFFRFFLID